MTADKQAKLDVFERLDSLECNLSSLDKKIEDLTDHNFDTLSSEINETREGMWENQDKLEELEWTLQGTKAELNEVISGMQQLFQITRELKSRIEGVDSHVGCLEEQIEA